MIDAESEPGRFAEMAGRVGLVTRGVLYLISAGLTVRIARGEGVSASEEGPGRSGALRAAVEQPFGRALVAVLALGLAGYAIWRLVAAVTYRGGQDDPAVMDWAKRLGYVVRGLVYPRRRRHRAQPAACRRPGLKRRALATAQQTGVRASGRSLARRNGGSRVPRRRRLHRLPGSVGDLPGQMVR